MPANSFYLRIMVVCIKVINRNKRDIVSQKVLNKDKTCLAQNRVRGKDMGLQGSNFWLSTCDAWRDLIGFLFAN